MASIVQKVHKENNVSRNVFDVSANNSFVTCAGQLLPVRVDEVMPNSEYRFSQSYFMRTLPLVVPSFARMKVHFDTFFVPYRLLGTDIQSIIVGNNRGMISNYNSDGTYSSLNKCLPYTTLFQLSPLQNPAWNADNSTMHNISDAAGYSIQNTSPTLIHALGYGTPLKDGDATPFGIPGTETKGLGLGNVIASSSSVSPVLESVQTDINSSSTTVPVSTLAVSVLPLLAYQKIYQDYYRNKLWENENRASYFLQSSDYGTSMTLSTMVNRGILEMRYHDLSKDRITGMVPDVSSVLSAGLSISNASVLGERGLDYQSGYYQDNAGLGSEQVPKALVSKDTSSASSGTLNALSLRRLEAFQKFAEITELNKNDYKHQIKAHFGFEVPDLNSDYCQYIGGFEDIVNISDVENTTSEQSAALSGKGVSAGNSRQFTFRANEHGMIMTICYIVPLVDYANLFVNRYCTHLNRYDFCVPEFDNIGFEPVRVFDVYNEMSNLPTALPGNATVTPVSILGYLPRYWEYKTKVDTAYSPFYNGNNKEITLNYGSYIIRFPYDRLIQNANLSTMYKAFKAIPKMTDELFSVAYDGNVENSPFVCTFYCQASAMLPLSVTGLPY